MFKIKIYFMKIKLNKFYNVRQSAQFYIPILLFSKTLSTNNFFLQSTKT